MILTGLQQALSAHGSSVTTENGWQGRGRGQMSSVKTITIHHTAGGNDAGDLKVVRDGRSDLPGPLAQILLRRNGIPHIIAAGQAAHAGTSRLEEYRNIQPKGYRALDVMEKQLAQTPYLCGESLSLADISSKIFLAIMMQSLSGFLVSTEAA